MKKSILILIMFCLLVGCRKDPVIEIYVPEQDSIKNIVYIERDDIYYLENFSSKPIKITNNSEEKKYAVRVSYDGTKAAYLNNLGGLKIINRSDTAVVVIEISGVKDFNWSADNQTLYYLKGQQLIFYGPQMDIPAMTIPAEVPFGADVNYNSVSISPQNDLAYTLTWTHYVSENEMYVGFYFIRKSLNGQYNIVVDAVSPQFKRVRYTGVKQDLVLTTSWNYYEDYKYYSGFGDDIPFSYPHNIQMPIYNSNGNFIMGFLKNSYDPAQYNLVLLNPAGSVIRKNKTLSLSLKITDLDWKQP